MLRLPHRARIAWLITALAACHASDNSPPASPLAAPADTGDDGGQHPGCRPLEAIAGPIDASQRDNDTACRTGSAGSAHACHLVGWSLVDALEGARDYQRALAYLACACERGDGGGCNAWGTMFDHGRGVREDPVRAAELYERACRDGSGEGCTNLAVDKERGRGMAVDLAEAKALYEAACSVMKEADACAGLGYLYERGLGVERDPERAVSLYGPACTQGSATACNNLGHACAEGRGRTRDVSCAVSNYQKACESDYPLGCANLGELYANGSGVEHDDAKAAELYDRGCQMAVAIGRDYACARLAQLVFAGRSNRIPPERAGTYAENACTAGESEGCIALGVRAMRSGNVEQARRDLTRGCDLGNSRACGGLRMIESRPGD